MQLFDYIPEPDDLEAQDIVRVRERLDTYLSQFWPDLDTRPNSPFGDLMLTPFSALVTALEQGVEKFKSDLDLNRIASGVIYDPEFVRAYLKNFGMYKEREVAATGVIKLIFNQDGRYIIDAGTLITFGNSKFLILPSEGNPIVIYPTTETNVQRRSLHNVGNGKYEVYLPVYGTAGALIRDADQATFDLDIESLESIKAAGNFDSGVLADSLPAMARKARTQFTSASLSSRTGAISFVNLHWPNISSVSAVVNGDAEMLRPGINPLGFTEGCMDLFVRSNPNLTRGEMLVPLVWDTVNDCWQGALRFPIPPSFFALKAGIFQIGNFENSRGFNRVFSRSVHPRLDGNSITFSKYEDLGVRIIDTNPSDYRPAYTSDVTPGRGSIALLKLGGEYRGHRFSEFPGRSVVLVFDGVMVVDGITNAIANVRDLTTGEVVRVLFRPNESGTGGEIVKDTVGYEIMFNGLDLYISQDSGVFNPSALSGSSYTFNFQGKTANFSVNYFYEPFVVHADARFADPDNKPVNVEVMVRNFLPCYIQQFRVSYRIRYGQQIDVEEARSRIVEYLHRLAYPSAYAESFITDIMLLQGASAVMHVAKRGFFYPSLASTYIDKQGNETPIPRIPTSTLEPPTNDFGLGARNIAYIIDPATIEFHAVIS